MCMMLKCAIQLGSLTLKVGERRPNPEFLRTAGLNIRPDALTGDEPAAFASWSKALFDPGSEGIEDTILRCVQTASGWLIGGNEKD